MKNTLFVKGIIIYQKYISPHKGYCCAYKHYTNKDSCSEFTKKSFIKYNKIKALILSIKHIKKCNSIYLINKKAFKNEKEKVSYCDNFAGCL